MPAEFLLEPEPLLKSYLDLSIRRFPFALGPLIPSALAIATALVVTPLAAQERRVDPLTRFIDGLLKRDNAALPTSDLGTAPAETPAPAAEGAASQDPVAAKTSPPAPRTKPLPKVAPTSIPSRKVDAARNEAPASGKKVREAPPSPAAEAASVQSVQRAAPTPLPKSSAPSNPQEALARLNAHFNGIDQMTAAFVQTGGDGRRVTGSLTLQRPGRFRFAYAAPSTLEIVSDGHNVAIRDAKLHTNDVYPVGQTPLKFLVQDHFDLARATTVRSVTSTPDGIVTVKFEDTATFGGTSQVELTYNAAADRLVQWIVTDPQGYQTTIVLNGVNVVRRQADGTN